MLFRNKISGSNSIIKEKTSYSIAQYCKASVVYKTVVFFQYKNHLQTLSSMRSRFLWRYDWLSGFAKCENSTAQVQATLRALRLHHSLTSVLYIWGGGTAAPLPWLIFCTHSSMEKAGWWKRAAALVVDLIPFAAGRKSVKDKWWWNDLRVLEFWSW